MIEGKVAPDEGSIIRHSHVIVGYWSQNMEEQDTGGNTLKSREIIDLEREMADLEFELSGSAQKM
jgi:ATPase subunit of ABC transporter with duplicated ATPase domains